MRAVNIQRSKGSDSQRLFLDVEIKYWANAAKQASGLDIQGRKTAGGVGVTSLDPRSRSLEREMIDRELGYGTMRAVREGKGRRGREVAMELEWRTSVYGFLGCWIWEVELDFPWDVGIQLVGWGLVVCKCSTPCLIHRTLSYHKSQLSYDPRQLRPCTRPSLPSLEDCLCHFRVVQIGGVVSGQLSTRGSLISNTARRSRRRRFTMQKKQKHYYSLQYTLL